MEFACSQPPISASAGTSPAGRGRTDGANTRERLRDPIGEAGGWNLYAFVKNNPIQKFDMLGETAQTATSIHQVTPHLANIVMAPVDYYYTWLRRAQSRGALCRAIRDGCGSDNPETFIPGRVWRNYGNLPSVGRSVQSFIRGISIIADFASAEVLSHTRLSRVRGACGRGRTAAERRVILQLEFEIEIRLRMGTHITEPVTVKQTDLETCGGRTWTQCCCTKDHLGARWMTQQP